MRWRYWFCGSCTKVNRTLSTKKLLIVSVILVCLILFYESSREKVNEILGGAVEMNVKLLNKYFAHEDATDMETTVVNKEEPGRGLSTTHQSQTLLQRTAVAGELNHRGNCTIPKLTVWNQITKHYWMSVRKIDCTRNPKFPPIFTTDLMSTLIQLEDPKNYNLSDCCYTPILTNTADNYEKFLNECIPITENKTKMPFEIEFFRISCRNLSNPSKIPNKYTVHVDYLGFARFSNPKSLPRIINFTRNISPEIKQRTRPNLIIFGLDSTSHMNLQRIYPKTFKYITKKLGAIGMNGYTKVGLNTLPNLVAALTGRHLVEVENKLDRNKLIPFISDKIVWKEYERQGYATSFIEDSPSQGVFTYRRNGFSAPPTDFYSRPLFRQAEKYMGHTKTVNYYVCYSWRSSYARIIDYMKKVSKVMQTVNTHTSASVPLFMMTWASALFHDFSHLGQVVDDDTLEMFQSFHEEGRSSLGNVNNTIFIFMSDHGIRYGQLRSTTQGLIEERMPFVYFIFPPWFSKNYPRALQNFKNNQAKLTTHFDLHETLKDLSNLDNIEDTAIERREIQLLNNYTRGISLMLPIPVNRNCKQADIPEQFCICLEARVLDLDGPQANDIIVVANVGVKYINEQFKKYKVEYLCQQVSLHNVTSAQEIKFNYDSNVDKPEIKKSITLRVSFYTMPGPAPFDGQFRKVMPHGNWTIDGSVERLNSYGRKSWCVSLNWRLKPMCTCKNETGGNVENFNF